MGAYKDKNGTWYAQFRFTNWKGEPDRKTKRGFATKREALDGTLISIDCTAVENEVADNMYQRSELDWLIYNDPAAYADLILNGDPEIYLKSVTENKPLD